MVTLLIDNFDSFTYNIADALRVLGVEVIISRSEINRKPDFVVIGPGPGRPESAEVSKRAINEFLGKIPILGICLGHQLIAQVFGGRIIHAQDGPMHGKTSPIIHNGEGILHGIEQGFIGARYHSLAVEKNSLPDFLEITAETSSGEIMGIKHREFPLYGVQFHPDSVITTCGPQIFKNFIGLTL